MSRRRKDRDAAALRAIISARDAEIDRLTRNLKVTASTLKAREHELEKLRRANYALETRILAREHNITIGTCCPEAAFGVHLTICDRYKENG